MTAKRNVIVTIVLLFSIVALVPSARAERPTAPKLLPKETLAYIRIHKMPEMVSKFNKTSMGRLAADEKIRPLLGQLYESAEEGFGGIEEQLGVSLSEILSIPQGEVCVAMVPTEGMPVPVILLEVAEQLPAAERLLQRFEEEVVEDGARKRTDKTGDTELTIYAMNGDFELITFIRDGVVAMVANRDVCDQLLAVWDGEETETLADNRRFATIMRRCAGTKDERPQVSWYVDPIDIAKRVTRGNFGAQAGMALLEPLGLDGLKAIGGSMILNPEEFDSIMHFHVMLANPREGVIKMVAFKPGEVTPESWVPKDAASYMTMNWEFGETYDTLNKLYDLLRGEGEMELAMQGLSDRINVDIRNDLVDAAEGRVTMLTWMSKPVRLNSQTTMMAMKLKDAKKFENTLEKIIETNLPQAETEKYGGVSYYMFGSERPRRPGADGEPRIPGDLIRQPRPCVAILGDYLVATDSEDLLKRAVAAKNDANNSLARELDFKLIASQISRQVGSSKPAMITFSRPEEAMRLVYELATADNTRSRLSEAADNNGFFRAVNNALNDNPLPPFSVIASYLAPTGGMLVSDDTGIHFTAFALKRESP